MEFELWEFMLSPTAALSPAARLASIERSVRPLPPAPASSSYYLGDYAGTDADSSFTAVLATPSGLPGILSPAALLPAASSGIFSPLPYAFDPGSLSWLADLSPFLPSAGACAAGLEAPFAPSPPSTALPPSASSLPPPTAGGGATGNSSLPTPPLSRRPTTGKVALWVAQVGDEEQRLRASLRHLQAEAGVLERLVYKHRNQHHGAAYFQYLLKVRRDLKLLLGAGLAEILNAVFPVLACRKPANTILLPGKQTKKKPGANHSHYERLLGVARLLSQMAEPVMKAAIQILFLLARSFFVDLCMAVFALLARVRVLIQQMFLDIVSVYNKITDLTDRKQAVKVTVGGVQAFREYYPSSNDTRTILECVWVKDKYVLHEKMKGSFQKTEDEDQKSCGPESSIQYERLGVIHEEMVNPEESNSQHKQPDAALAEQPDKINRCSSVGGSQSGRKPENEISDGPLPKMLSACVPSVLHLDPRPETRKRVAFIAVGKPKVIVTTSETKSSEVNKKQKVDMIPHTTAEYGDLFRKLLDSENADKSIF